jgi:hypothetical protein
MGYLLLVKRAHPLSADYFHDVFALVSFFSVTVAVDQSLL